MGGGAMRRKVKSASFTETSGQHTTGADTRKGTVTVEYPSGMTETFYGINRKDFFQWKQSGWRERDIPFGVRIREADPRYDDVMDE